MIPKSENDSFCARIITRVGRTPGAVITELSTWDPQDREMMFTTLRHVYAAAGFDIAETARITRLPVSFINYVFSTPEFASFSDDSGAAKVRAQMIHQAADRRLMKMLLDDDDDSGHTKHAALVMVRAKNAEVANTEKRVRAQLEIERAKTKGTADLEVQKEQTRRAQVSGEKKKKPGTWVIGGRNDE